MSRLHVRSVARDNAFEAEVVSAVRRIWDDGAVGDSDAWLYSGLLMPHRDEGLPNEHDIVLLTDFGMVTIDAKGLRPAEYQGGPNDPLTSRRRPTGRWRPCPKHISRPFTVAFRKGKVARGFFTRLGAPEWLPTASCIVAPNHADLGQVRGRRWSADEMRMAILNLSELRGFLETVAAACRQKPATRLRWADRIPFVDRKVTAQDRPAHLDFMDMRWTDRVSSKQLPVASEGWHARHLTYDQDAFVKVFHCYPWTEGSRAFFKQLDRRVKILRRAQHPHIIRLSNHSSGPDCVILEYERFDAPTLEERVEALGALPLGDALRIAEGVASGIAHLHSTGQGQLTALHRALDHTAILIRPDLSDFRVVNFSNLTIVEGSTVPRFSPESRFQPEEMIEATHPDRRKPTVDVYSIGRLLLYMLAGDAGLEGTDSPLLAELPPAVGALIARATARRANDRHPTCAELATAIAAASRAV